MRATSRTPTAGSAGALLLTGEVDGMAANPVSAPSARSVALPKRDFCLRRPGRADLDPRPGSQNYFRPKIGTDLLPADAIPPCPGSETESHRAPLRWPTCAATTAHGQTPCARPCSS